MTPVIVLLALIAAGGGGFAAGICWRRMKPRELTSKLAETERELERTKGVLATAVNNHDWQKTYRERAETERDKALEIAETHEVKLPKVPVSKVQVRKVWKGRKYSHHPNDNLLALKQDLNDEFKGKRVQITLTLTGQGGWPAIIQKKWGGGSRRTTISDLSFEGPPKRVVAEIEAFLTDVDHGLVRVSDKSRNYGKKVWKDDDSPLVFIVSLEVEEKVKPPPLPTTHEVQVAVVRTEIVEHEVQVPVFEAEEMEEPPEGSIAHLDQEELVAVIDAVLEVRATEGKRVPAISGNKTDTKKVARQVARQIKQNM